MDITKIHSKFVRPGAEYRGKPFWSWNGELKKDELIRQAHVLGEMGFGGHFMHSRCGLITEYLGDEWFDLINAVADASEAEGLEAWLYDEDRWPSGSAGGKVTEDPQYRMKSLYLYEMSPEAFSWDEEIVCAFAAVIGEDGLSVNGYHALPREDASEAAFAGLNDAEGTRKVLAFKIVPDAPNNNYNGNTYIDTMSRAAVDRFIQLTHEEYRKRCGDRIGRSIKGIFTDEPHRGHAMDNFSEKDGIRSSAIFYTDDIFEEFRSRYGYDALPLLPEIFYRLHGEPVSKVRIDFFDLGCNLFNERFTIPINDWCGKNGILLTGHVLHEDSLTNQSVPNGSLMRFYQHSGYPGIDILGNDNTCYWAAKQCSSVCRQFGKKWMLSELYGCSGWEFTLRSHKMIGDWQALFGVNVRCPHLSWYTMEGECKRDYPASISYQSPYWQDYDFVESYFARLGLMLSEGKPVCDLLVLSPVESVWALANLAWASWINPTQSDVYKLERIYAETFMKLAGARIDFDYGEEQIMAQNGRIENGILHIGQAEYRTVLVSGALTVRESTIKLLRELLETGGKVIFTGELPKYVGGVPSDACKALLDTYNNAVYVEFDSLREGLHEIDSCPIQANAGKTVFNQVRRNGDDYISVWLNTDRVNATGDFTVMTSLPAGYRPELWNPETGERQLYPYENKDGTLTLTCSLEAAGTMILVFTPSTDEIAAYEKSAPVVTGTLTDGEFDYTLDEPNVMVLDYTRYRFGDDTDFSELGEVLKIDQQLRDRLHIERRGVEMLQPWFAKQKYTVPYGKLTLEYPFRVEVMPEGKVYLAGERPEAQEYYCNGVRLTYSDLNDWWVDNAFVKMEIPDGVLKSGKNVITVVTDFKRTTNIEAVYLVGSFGVKACAGASEVISLPKTLGLDDMAKRNLPFYSGRVTLTIPAEKYAPLTDSTAEHIKIQVPAYSGALVTVEAGNEKIPLAWEPYTADITQAVKEKLPIEITLVNTRRNSFGPLHIVPTIHGAYGPGHFLTSGSSWHDAYSLIEAKIGAIKFLK